ncbi:MAG: hypothetical protein ABR499_03780 [Gemmatimonadaceae bacterium]
MRTRGAPPRRARVGRFAWRLAAALLVTGGSRAYAQDPTRVIIKRAEIEAAGWFNLGEVLTGATGWHRATLDGVSFFASADGLPAGAVAPGEPEWLVLVDGQRVTSDLLGAKLLELLPISPAEVDSVTVTRVPRLVAGTIAGRGVVDFHTGRTRGRGPAIAAAWHTGNVIGDPGPYQFTPLATENVDRLGPYNHAFASFAGGGREVSAGVRQGSSHITHRGIRERFDPALYEQLGVHKWAPYDVVHARVGTSLLGGRHDVVAGRGWVNGPLFLPLAGGEQWLRGAFDHIGGSGSLVSGATTLAYQLTRSALDVDELPSPFPFVVGHSRQRTAGVLEVRVRDDGGRYATLAAAATRWAMERGGTSAARTDVTLVGNLTAAIGRSVSELSAALARSSGGPIVAKGVLATRVAGDSLTTLSAALSYVQHATGDDGTWIDRALLGLDTLARERDARAWVDVGAARRARSGWLAELGARVGVVDDVRLLAVDGLPAGGPVDGAVAELRAGLALPLRPRLPVARVAYRYGTPVGGGAGLRAALRATPAHTLEASVVAAPASDLRLGAFVNVASRARWAALRGGPAAPVTLPARTRLDVSAEKWFWRHHVRTQLLFRNLLNQSERYHPLGADFPLRVHFTVALALPPLAAAFGDGPAGSK